MPNYLQCTALVTGDDEETAGDHAHDNSDNTGDDTTNAGGGNGHADGGANCPAAGQRKRIRCLRSDCPLSGEGPLETYYQTNK